MLSALERFPLPRSSPFINQFFNVLHGRRAEPSELNEFIVRRCWATDQGVVASRVRGLEGFDVTDRLWSLETPSLILAGTRDVVVTPARQKALADGLPNAAFETIEGGGHVGFVTHRERVARRVAAFMTNAATCC